MRLNCVIVEDSAVQRIIISKLVNNHPQLNLVGDFSNAIEAKNCLSLKMVDLVFLDIEMPVINGFAFLDGLKNKPQIIFIASKSEYALKAFDYEATDFVHKPIDLNRFDVAIKKALNLHSLKNEPKEESGDHIFVKCNLKKIKIYTSKIKWIEAFGDYVKVVSEEDNNLVLSTMKSFESILNKEKFVRVHKSFIINIDKVERYNSKFAEIGGTKIPLSRHKKEELSKAFGNSE